MTPGPFVEPPWAEPLDVARTLAGIPDSARIAGMFFLALQEGAERRQATLGFPKARYLPFGFYPVREFAPLLVEAAGKFYPGLSLREGLRRIGTAGPVAFLSSTLGKVTLGASEGVHATVAAIAKTYGINTRPSRCEILHAGPRSMTLTLDDVVYFLDSHHVGVFEGTLHYAGVDGRVKIAARSETSAELLLEW
ncbi:MAG TPA: DUF2378 family protein [Polyangiaceae bacterium]|nr:DUF2378 family protein [Polyangiaceae bacterium]